MIDVLPGSMEHRFDDSPSGKVPRTWPEAIAVVSFLRPTPILENGLTGRLRCNLPFCQVIASSLYELFKIGLVHIT
jgi:hypothetical protein